MSLGDVPAAGENKDRQAKSWPSRMLVGFPKEHGWRLKETDGPSDVHSLVLTQVVELVVSKEKVVAGQGPLVLCPLQGRIDQTA